MATVSLELGEIQGLIIRGYSHPHTRFVLFTIGDGAAARAWLDGLVDQFTYAVKWETKPETLLNIAFTAAGLEALGVPLDVMATFSEEFRHGMHNRAEVLGDSGSNDPTRWEFGQPGEALHGMLLLYGVTDEAVVGLLEAQTAAMRAAGMTILSVQEGFRRPDKIEHFGFLDGIAQPTVRESVEVPPDPKQNSATPVEGQASMPGEFVLGYPNEYHVIPPQPRDPLGKNGSYLVYRKLHQHVAAFWNYLREQTESESEMEWAAAKLVGRWRSGVPLAKAPNRDNAVTGERMRLNAFNYADDMDGYKTPVTSHIRRVNPRDDDGDPTSPPSFVESNRHRLIRRGIGYGKLPRSRFEDDGEERGVHFIAINANISIQFEFIQQTWMNNTKFHGLYNDTDPFTHSNDGTTDATIPREPFRRRLKGMPQFVEVRGGAYFFLPSRTALRALAAKAW